MCQWGAWDFELGQLELDLVENLAVDVESGEGETVGLIQHEKVVQRSAGQLFRMIDAALRGVLEGGPTPTGDDVGDVAVLEPLVGVVMAG